MSLIDKLKELIAHGDEGQLQEYAEFAFTLKLSELRLLLSLLTVARKLKAEFADVPYERPNKSLEGDLQCMVCREENRPCAVDCSWLRLTQALSLITNPEAKP